ncbi:MAG: T9SS type A sorting domain-containing protein [Flavobacteriales bacterium]
MKLIYLLIAALPFLSIAQSFDVNNEANIGSLASLHLCDSNANIQANNMGANVTWDFSQIAGIFGVTKDVQILDATLDANYASFAGSTKMYDIGGNIQTFFSSTASGRVSQGFVFNEVSLGAVVASWSTDQENLMTYPLTYGSSPLADAFSGTVTSTATGTLPATGTSVTMLDAIGTLILPGGNSYNNVLRFHLKDSAIATVLGTNVAFVRNVYEYYDFSVNNLPIFITMSVNVNSALINNSSTIILSKDQPQTFVGGHELSLPSIQLYPNPAFNQIQLEGAQIGDHFKVVTLTGSVLSTGTYAGSIDVTNLSNGVYLLQINGQTVEFIK